MKPSPRIPRRFARLWPTLVAIALPLLSASAQYYFGVPNTPQAQRGALNAVRSRGSWLQNATKSAPSFGPQGSSQVWQAFQDLRFTYGSFKNSLTPRQLSNGANQFAELDAGLDIIQEAFANYEQDLAAGQPVGAALRTLCRVMREASNLWLQELNKTCTQLQVGW